MTLISKDENYFINNPIYVKYRTTFDVLKMKRVRRLKSAYINERIIEIPFALAAVSALPRKSAILDLGCTESPLALQLACLGYKVTGMDFRGYPYTHPNLDFVQGDLMELPFEDEQFDAVLAISTLEHLGVSYYENVPTDDQGDLRVAAQIRRILKPGGLFVCTVPYGQAKLMRHQRVYDEQLLQKVLTGFDVLEERFYQNNLENGSCNCWLEIDRSAAGGVVSGKYTLGVSLIKAVKKAV